MSLFDLIDNTRTDKNTVHSYLDLYQQWFEGKKDTAKNVLEVGIAYEGGSIRLWYDYFKNATVYGIDVIPLHNMWHNIINVKDPYNENHKIELHNSCDAYNESWFNETFLNKGIKCDILIDDGPHTLESMVRFIQLYSQIMTDDGMLIIEDVQDINWIETLKQVVPDHLKRYIEVYDRRHIKGRYDDIMFVIDRSKKSS